MVIEEAPVPDADAPSEGPHLVVLSARTIDQLRDAARNLLMHCQRHPELNCADVSYTLLTGRRHLAVRFTACVQTLAELSAALDGWLATGTARGVAAGKVKEGHHHGDAASARLTRDAVIALGGLRGDERRDALIAIAGRFVEGHRLEPTDLFRGERRRRVGLPTYPFAADRFWVGPSPRAHGASGRVIPGFQPLLRAEAADGPGRHYRAIFTGREPFFRDHVIHGVSILPAVVHLEMARAAVDDARPRSDATLHLTDVTFAHALDASDSPIELAVDLADLGGGTMSVVARSGAADDQETVHCTAKVSWSDAEPQPSVDLAALRQLARATYSGDECYAHLASLGAVYGPMHRGVQRVVIAISDTGLSVAVADIAIPESVRDGAAAYVLHPSVLDAGLQAAAAFELNGGTAGHTAKTLPVPFCIDRMEVYAALPAAAVACVTRRATEGTATRILDVDLCTRDGAVCARLIGVAARPVPPASADETTLWVPRWRAEPLDPPAGPAPGRLHWLAICPCGTADEQLAFREYAARLQEALPRATCELLPACPTSPESALGAIARFVLSHMHRLLRGQPPVEVCYQVVLPSHPNGALCAAISALLRTANSESSHLTGQVILLDQKIDAPRMAERLAADTTTNATRISYSEGVRHVEAFEGAVSAALGWCSPGRFARR
jgi:acyl transferase domain-containing protein